MRLFVTGSDTGVGKTILTALLARAFIEAQIPVRAFKPISSGRRDDAHALRRALNNAISIDQINPWHFKAALAPTLAARRQNSRLRLAEVVAWLDSRTLGGEKILVEGAGGLLSPLGEDFDNRDLLNAIGALPIIVVPNRLGAVNQVRLTLEALPHHLAAVAPVVLSSAGSENAATRSNPDLIREAIGRPPWILERVDNVFRSWEEMPRLREWTQVFLCQLPTANPPSKPR